MTDWRGIGQRPLTRHSQGNVKFWQTTRLLDKGVSTDDKNNITSLFHPNATVVAYYGLGKNLVNTLGKGGPRGRGEKGERAFIKKYKKWRGLLLLRPSVSQVLKRC